MEHMKIPSLIYKTLCMHKNPKLLFTSKQLILLQLSALPFKAGDICAHANHMSGLKTHSTTTAATLDFVLLYTVPFFKAEVVLKFLKFLDILYLCH